MKQRILVFVYGFIAWTIFFLIARALFLTYHAGQASELSTSDIMLTFVHGIRMDWATAGYICLFPGLLLASTFFLRGRIIWSIWFGYHILILLLTSFVIVLDFELYRHWGFRLDATPLLYIGKEAAGSGDFWISVLLIVFWLIIFSLSLYSLRKFFKKRIENLEKISWKSIPVFLVVTALLVIPIRGSFGVAPMNTGFVYFHPTNVFANHAAINVVWNFGYAIHKVERLKYPDKYFNKERTNHYYSQLFPADKKSETLLNTDSPNVLIIMMESYTYKFIEALGGYPGVAPNFNRLVHEGILFDNFYSSGDRTDKGLISVLSGYPAQPLASIIKYPNKSKNLPFLNQVFKERGYHTEFSYGYNIDYANFRSYLINAGFDHLTHSESFPDELNTSKWGVHDHFVFEKFFEETQNAPEPFFKIMMTQSSHEPFEVPMETVIEGDDNLHMFMNSAYYADKSLGDFIAKAKQTEWWKKALVIVVADHGHPMFENIGFSPERFKIPMLWLGGALNAKDTVIHTIGGHSDIANSILGQVGIHEKEFAFSNNLLAPHDGFAVYVYNNGFGMIVDQGSFIYDNNARKIISEKGNIQETDIEKGKAYMQKLYWDFNSR